MVATKEKAISSHAAAAKAIRAELKAKFPGVEFRVRASSYSMGDEVTTNWTNGPTERRVDEIVNRYEMGRFDGMADCYEYSNRRKDIPQVKFVFTRREYSEEIVETERAAFNAENWHKKDGEALTIDDERGVFDLFRCSPASLIRERLSKKDFTDSVKSSREATK